MAGRPRGTTKDPNRRKVKNPDGRRIDFEGTQYNKWIKSGYKLNRDGIKLVIDRSFTGDRNATRSVGRPRGRAAAVPDSQKVKNPESGRPIKKDANTFKKLTKKYVFDEEKNKFITRVFDPKQNSKIFLNSPKFKKRIEHGYIYDKLNNSLTTRSKKIESAFGNAFVTYDLVIMSKDDPLVQMQKLNNRITTLLKRSLKRLNGIKFNIRFGIEFTKTVSNNNELTEVNEIFYMNAKIQPVLHESDICSSINYQNNNIRCIIDRYTVGGSGWTVGRIVSHQINIYQNQLIRARGYIKLPDWINNKKATINIQNKDDKCFIYYLGIRFDSNPETKNLERVSKHLKIVCSELGFDKIKTPVKVKDIGKIAKQFNISINLFAHNDIEKIPYPIKQCGKVVDDSKHIDLLITTDEEENYHYVWIKIFNKLCHNHTKHNGKTVFNVLLQIKYLKNINQTV